MELLRLLPPGSKYHFYRDSMFYFKMNFCHEKCPVLPDACIFRRRRCDNRDKKSTYAINILSLSGLFSLKKKMLSLFRNVWSVTALPSFFHETVVGVRWSLQNRFEKHKNYYLVHILYIRYTRKTSEQQFFSLYLSVFFKRAWVC